MSQDIRDALLDTLECAKIESDPDLDYLREQPSNIQSFDLVAQATHFLSLYYSNVKDDDIVMVTVIFNALLEIVSVTKQVVVFKDVFTSGILLQGNTKNQMVVFDMRVCDYINVILMAVPGQVSVVDWTDHADRGCFIRRIKMLQAIAQFTEAMVEEDIPGTKDVRPLGVAKVTTPLLLGLPVCRD
ncbi:hypothetical protein NP493_1263g00024 [Ridgeia piscesae]|uniref:Uncharacterized protein n=1 Tax=Ridgeia piscesae TaxID=27915 RepID=A0AAD9KAL4_RIDPI|nr:hypothetical protein NP493_1263g00024 [Ridgeia piscesae]